MTVARIPANQPHRRGGHDTLAAAPVRVMNAPSRLVALQATAGNRAVSRMMSLQRCGSTPPDQCPCHGPVDGDEDAVAPQQQSSTPFVQREPDPEGEPALIEQLEREIAAADRDGGQDGDLMLRPYGTRVGLLLRHRAHPRFETQQQLDEYLDSARRLGKTEIDTLNALGSLFAELAMATAPKGFPLTWSGKVHAALSLGTDAQAVVGEAAQQFAALSAQADELPPRLADKGLPVPLADISGLRTFELHLAQCQLPGGNTVGDFARATAKYAQFRFFSNFALSWELIVDNVAGAVADGSYVPKSRDYDDFVKNRQQILRELPSRARERLAMTDEELLAIQRDSLGLADAALLTGMASGLSGLLGVLSGWDQGAALFGTALRTTDGMVAGGGDGDRVAMAFRWMWEAGYLGGAGGEAVRAMIANGPEMLAGLAAILVLQMIPFVDVAVDIYLLFQLGKDVLKLLTETGLAFADVTSARSVVQLQHAAGRLARVLAAGGIQILTTLITMGVVKGVSALRARAAKIRAAEPSLSAKEAEARAMGEAPAAERAPLEATRGLDTWERGLTRETKPILDTPGVRTRLAEASDRTRKMLTLCASPCLPPANQLLAADLKRLDGILDRIGVNGEHQGLREYFYRRRNTLVQAIEDLDNGMPAGANLPEFLDRSIVTAANVPSGTALFKDPQGRWVYRRGPGKPGVAEVVEYDIRSYAQHQTGYGTRSFFQSHHGIQGEWAMERGVPGYNYSEAQCILLRDSRAGSPHQIVTGRQAGRVAGRGSRTYADERALLQADLQAAGVPPTYVQEAVRLNDNYFATLYERTPAGRREALFGTWKP